jgi:hypothetical protein
LDAPVEACIDRLMCIERPFQLRLRHDPDITLDPAGGWVVELDERRVGTEIIKPSPDRIGRPASLHQALRVTR